MNVMVRVYYLKSVIDTTFSFCLHSTGSRVRIYTASNTCNCLKKRAQRITLNQESSNTLRHSGLIWLLSVMLDLLEVSNDHTWIHPLFMHASYLVCLDYLHYLPFVLLYSVIFNQLRTGQVNSGCASFWVL